MKYLLIMLSIFFFNFNVKADIWTLEIGSLYSQCKPYQNANFDFEKLSKSDQVKAMLCKTTLIGIANTGYNLCQSLRWYYKSADNKNTKKALNGLSSWYANEMIKNQDQLIIGFNEWAEKNQHNWKKYITGIAFKRDFMAKRYFCNF